jgi:hypothetical protein
MLKKPINPADIYFGPRKRRFTLDLRSGKRYFAHAMAVWSVGLWTFFGVFFSCFKIEYAS